jgi:magnesium chelatase family protein
MLTSGGKLTMNPCNCGFWRTGLRECRCSDGDVARYRSRISGPLLDRIDLYVDVPRTDVDELCANAKSEEASATVRRRVGAARHRRQHGGGTRLTADASLLLTRASRAMELSARGITRTIAVSRTIACLSGREQTEEDHIAEALQYRVPSRDWVTGRA